MASANFPGRPFALRMEGSLSQQDIAGNRSLFAWQLWIDKLSYSPTWSNSGNSSWNATIQGASVGSAGGLNFDFRNGNNFLIGQGSNWFNHNPDGSFPNGAAAFAGYANYDLLGYTEVHFNVSVPRIPRGPRVLYGGVWRNTVPYVMYGGVWRVAIPYVKYGGVWRIGGG